MPTTITGSDISTEEISGTLFIDSANNRVGIGTNSPQEALVVKTPDEDNVGLEQNRYALGIWDEDGGTEQQKGIAFLRQSTGRLVAGIEPFVPSGGGAHLDFFTGPDDDVSRRARITKDGDFDIFGSLSKSSGSFKIDHPLPEKSETHHLVHSFVESPLADNIYRGLATLTDGTAQVNIDSYTGMTEGTFSALNGNPQVFLQNESGFEPVKGHVTDNILHIQCRDETSTDTISWMVVAERQDQHMLDTEWTDEFGRPVLEPEKNPEPDEKLDSDGEVI